MQDASEDENEGRFLTYENACHDCRVIVELVAQKEDSPLPTCPDCGKPMERMVSAPAVIWTKPMAAYGSKSSEGYHQQQQAGGHWAFEKTPEGKATKTFIDTPQAQSEYCKRNGLIDPKNVPGNLSVNADGRSYNTVNKCEI